MNLKVISVKPRELIEIFFYDFSKSPLHIFTGNIPVVMEDKSGTFTAIFEVDDKIPFIKDSKDKAVKITDIRQFDSQNQVKRNYVSLLKDGPLSFAIGMTFIYCELSDLVFRAIPPRDLLDVVNLLIGFIGLKIAYRQYMNPQSKSNLMLQAYTQWREHNGDYTHLFEI